MWDAAFAVDVTLVTSSLSILECLVVPERDSDVQLIWTLNKCSALHGAFLCRQFPTPHSALRPGYVQNINRLKARIVFISQQQRNHARTNC